MDSFSANVIALNEWTDNANRYIKTISSQLSEMESLLNNVPENDINLFEILECIDDIQKQHESIIKIMESGKGSATVNENKNDLQNQLKYLNQAFKLMQLELDDDVFKKQSSKFNFY